MIQHILIIIVKKRQMKKILLWYNNLNKQSLLKKVRLENWSNFGSNILIICLFQQPTKLIFITSMVIAHTIFSKQSSLFVALGNSVDNIIQVLVKVFVRYYDDVELTFIERSEFSVRRQFFQ